MQLLCSYYDLGDKIVIFKVSTVGAIDNGVGLHACWHWPKLEILGTTTRSLESTQSECADIKSYSPVDQIISSTSHYQKS